MRRFFFDPASRCGEQVTLTADESKHVTKVLRLKPGTEVELLDGLGRVFSGEICSTGKWVQVDITGILIDSQETLGHLRVLQAMLKGDKMDSVVQKCTELGVAEMVPFHSSRCQGKLNSSIAEKKHGRWQRIGLAACKQCFRPKPMSIVSPISINEALTRRAADSDSSLKLLFWEEERLVRLQDIEGIEGADSIEILLGPEGGISEEEVAQAKTNGWQTVSLGENVLRAETATVTAVSIVQFLSGRL